MSNVKLSLTAISAALGLAIALQTSTAMAQNASAISAEALKGTQFAGPEYVRYSWGLEKVSFDAQPVKYTWAEISARLAQNAQVKPAVQGDARPVSADALKGTEFDSPEYVRYSWGLEKVSFDTQPVKYTWSDVNARLASAVAKSKSAPQANAQPIPVELLRGTQFDGPDFVRHDWGLENVQFDAPSVRLNWAEIKDQLG